MQHLYTDIDNIKEYYDDSTLIQLTDDTGNSENVDEVVINEAIKHSNGLINAFIQGKYNLPTSKEDTPELLKGIARFFVIYYLWIRRNGEGTPEQRADYSANMRLLEKIRAGEIDVGLTLNNSTNQIKTKIYSEKTNLKFSDDLLNKF